MATSNYLLGYAKFIFNFLAITFPFALGLIYEGAKCEQTTEIFDNFSGGSGQTCYHMALNNNCDKICGSDNGGACSTNKPVKELCPYSCEYVSSSESRSDRCSDKQSRVILKCLNVTGTFLQWVPTKYCKEVVCNMSKSAYDQSLEDAIDKLEAGKTKNMVAMELLKENRICPTTVNLGEVYAMYSLASSLNIIKYELTPEKQSSQSCLGFESHNPCVWSGVHCVQNRVLEISFQLHERCLNRIEQCYCEITGRIPTQIEHLIHVSVLNLGGNKVRGSIPAEIGQMTKLKKLALDRNQMTGRIPNEIFSLTQLFWLGLDTNCFNGKISNQLHSLKNLELLSLHDNRFKGSIPTSLTQLRKLCKFLHVIL